MQPMYYIGLDVHKRKISYYVKDGSGKVSAEGSLAASARNSFHEKAVGKDSSCILLAESATSQWPSDQNP